MYFVLDCRDATQPETHVLQSRYYAIGTDRLLELLQAAGFADTQRLDGVFFQPVLIGTRP